MSNQDMDSGLPSSSNGSDFSNLPRGAIGRRGLPSLRNARLPSIRSPRDLTLGGAPKKTYVPNIPLRKEKSVKPKPVTRTERGNDAVIPRGGRNDVRGSRGRDRNRNRPDLIQSRGGVFSEGSAEAAKKNSSYSAYSSQREKSGSSKTALPSMKKEIVLENCNESILNDIMRDDFIDDSDDENDNASPVILPLCAKSESQGSKNNVVRVKEERVHVKSDPADSSVNNSYQENATAVAMEPSAASELFTGGDEGDGKLFLFQFPDRISFSPRLEETSTATNSQGSQSTGISLDELPEGLIGKLQKMKSGKTRLVLGSTILDVELGTPVGFLQDIMSIKTNETGGDMTVLGHVRHTLNCQPNIDDLLSKCSL